ncbi:MAG: hypothetical protein ABFS30_07585 [Pseudomonadota bacterium]
MKHILAQRRFLHQLRAGPAQDNDQDGAGRELERRRRAFDLVTAGNNLRLYTIYR